MFAINVILTVKEADQIEKVAALLIQAAEFSRAEPGCLHYEVCHAENEPNVFMLIERWESKEAWEVHKTAEGVITIYQPQVIPLVDRVPYFCKVLE